MRKDWWLAEDGGRQGWPRRRGYGGRHPSLEAGDREQGDARLVSRRNSQSERRQTTKGARSVCWWWRDPAGGYAARLRGNCQRSEPGSLVYSEMHLGVSP